MWFWHLNFWIIYSLLNSSEVNEIFITSGSLNSSEIIDVNQGYDTCAGSRPPAGYPLKVKGAVGTYIGGKPMVCGGRSSIEDYFRSCHFYNVNNDTWTAAEPMREPRFQVSVTKFYNVSHLISRNFESISNDAFNFYGTNFELFQSFNLTCVRRQQFY